MAKKSRRKKKKCVVMMRYMEESVKTKKRLENSMLYCRASKGRLEKELQTFCGDKRRSKHGVALSIYYLLKKDTTIL